MALVRIQAPSFSFGSSSWRHHTHSASARRTGRACARAQDLSGHRSGHAATQAAARPHAVAQVVFAAAGRSRTRLNNLLVYKMKTAARPTSTVGQHTTTSTYWRRTYDDESEPPNGATGLLGARHYTGPPQACRRSECASPIALRPWSTVMPKAAR